MEGELLEIQDFLAAHPPFAQLPVEDVASLVRAISIRYLRRGSVFPPADTTGETLYIVRKGAAELRDAQEELVEKLGEGDFFAEPCLDNRHASLTGITVEDTLLYLIPCTRLQSLRQRFPEFDEQFGRPVAQRLRRAMQFLAESPWSGGGLLTVNVDSLASHPAIHVSPDTSIREAAELMTRQATSSLLVIEGKRLLGILTDQDFRARCVAKSCSYDSPVTTIMTADPHRLSPDTPGFEALLTMTRLHVHHLPIGDEQGISGVLSVTDLIHHQSHNTIFIAEEIRYAKTVEEITEAVRQLPELQLQLIASGTTGDQLGQAISTLVDAVTRRLLALAKQQLGEPPVHFAWISCGSQARHEQTTHSDQDNVLLLADGVTVEDQHYFEALARFVNDGLNACGFSYCPGNVMASNPVWRQPLSVWRRYFHDWIENPEPKALMHTAIFFDMRLVAGNEDLFQELRSDLLDRTQDNSIFLAYMAADALHHRPPLGFFRHFVLIRSGDHAKTLDLKHTGVIPVVDLARVYSLSAGIAKINTRERLEAAAQAGVLSEEGANNLVDALEYIATVRARHQARRIRQGQAPDNFVNPNELSALERRHLKDAFSIIHTQQQALAQRFQSERFF